MSSFKLNLNSQNLSRICSDHLKKKKKKLYFSSRTWNLLKKLSPQENSKYQKQLKHHSHYYTAKKKMLYCTIINRSSKCKCRVVNKQHLFSLGGLRPLNEVSWCYLLICHASRFPRHYHTQNQCCVFKAGNPDSMTLPSKDFFSVALSGQGCD